MQIFKKIQINDIALALKSGKAAILPTDTVWGIASIDEALIYQIKHRDPIKKVIKFVHSIDELKLPSFFVDVIKKYWPGSLSVIWKNISYRIPNCDYIIELLKITGPLYQSSANRSGNEPIGLIEQISSEFNDSLDKLVVVENDPFQQFSGKPSTIINLDQLKVVREGEINGKKIIDELKESMDKKYES